MSIVSFSRASTIASLLDSDGGSGNPLALDIDFISFLIDSSFSCTIVKANFSYFTELIFSLLLRSRKV